MQETQQLILTDKVPPPQTIPGVQNISQINGSSINGTGAERIFKSECFSLKRSNHSELQKDLPWPIIENFI